MSSRVVLSCRSLQFDFLLTTDDSFLLPLQGQGFERCLVLKIATDVWAELVTKCSQKWRRCVKMLAMKCQNVHILTTILYYSSFIKNAIKCDSDESVSLY